MSNQTTKQRVMKAAIQLFFQKGFHGTTTRDITNKINVNGSLISYHFNGKQGLLEEIVVSYYEHLITCMEQTMEIYKDASASTQLQMVIQEMMLFKQESFDQSVVVHRELSLDSTFVREVLVTYITKENHYLHHLLTNCAKEHPHLKKHIKFVTIQLKGMLIAPFTLHHEWKRDLFSPKIDAHTFSTYTTLLQKWLHTMFESDEAVQYMM